MTKLKVDSSQKNAKVIDQQKLLITFMFSQLHYYLTT